jgi:murein DD-endopeptidase MepM/ murein hydrolase activator NlpD
MVLPLIAGIGSKLLSSGKTEDKDINVSKKKIKTEKLFDKKGDSSALVKTEKSSIQLRPSSSLVKYNFKNSKDKSLDLTSEDNKNVVGDELQSVIDEVKKLRTNLVKVRGLLAEKKNFDLSKLVQNRKLLQLQKAKKRETDLEKRKSKLNIGKIEIPKPKISFLETIQNFFMNVLIGSLLNLLIANRNIIFKAFDDISKGLTNIFDVIRYSIISLSTTMPKLVKSVASFGKKIFAGPAKLTANLLKKLGGSIKNLLVKTGKALGNFVSGTFKNLRNLAGGTGTATTRASAVQQRGLSKGAGTKSQLRQLPKPGIPKPTSGTTLNNAQKLFTSGGFKHFKKVSTVFKKVPFIGALIGIGIDLAMGERLDNAIAGAAGASLGAAIGGAIGTAVLPIPFVGTFLGGTIGAAIGDWAGKEIYKKLSGQITQINPPPEPTTTPGQTPTPSPGTTPLSPGFMGSGAPGQLYTSNASVTWYNPGLGGINSGTGKPDPNARTSTGEPYQASAYTAAAFPPFLSSLPLSMTTRTPNNPSGRTLARGQQFNVLVTNKKTGKSAILRVNDVGSGVGPASKQTKWLDFSVAARDYLGTGSGFEIRMAPPGSKPGPLNASGVQQIQKMGAAANANATSSYTVAGITYDTATGRPIDFPGQRTSVPLLKQSQLPALPPTGTYSGQHYGASRKGGRKHAGVDFDISGNEKFYSRIGGVVTKVGHDPGGYGNYVDIYNADIGKTERIAEGKRVLVKKGDTINPGQAVVQGETETGVIHYEIRQGGGYGFSGTEDPTKFLASLDRGGGVRSTQAQALRQQASYEQRGGNIVIPTPIVSAPAPLPSPMAGAGGLLPIGMNKKDALNSYYQAQLIGFLYKQG